MAEKGFQDAERKQLSMLAAGLLDWAASWDRRALLGVIAALAINWPAHFELHERVHRARNSRRVFAALDRGLPDVTIGAFHPSFWSSARPNCAFSVIGNLAAIRPEPCGKAIRAIPVLGVVGSQSNAALWPVKSGFHRAKADSRGAGSVNGEPIDACRITAIYGLEIVSTGGEMVVPASARVDSSIRNVRPRLDDKSRSSIQNQCPW